MEISQDNVLQYFNFLKNNTTIKVENFLDVGALDGANSKLAQSTFDLKSDHIYMIEANPESAERIHNPDHFKLAVIAFGDEDLESVDIHCPQSLKKNIRGCASLLKRKDAWGEKILGHFKTYDMQMVKASTFMKVEEIKHRFDACIIDVEGFGFGV